AGLRVACSALNRSRRDLVGRLAHNQKCAESSACHQQHREGRTAVSTIDRFGFDRALGDELRIFGKWHHVARHYACYGSSQYASQAVRSVPRRLRAPYVGWKRFLRRFLCQQYPEQSELSEGCDLPAQREFCHSYIAGRGQCHARGRIDRSIFLQSDRIKSNASDGWVWRH